MTPSTAAAEVNRHSFAVAMGQPQVRRRVLTGKCDDDRSLELLEMSGKPHFHFRQLPDTAVNLPSRSSSLTGATGNLHFRRHQLPEVAVNPPSRSSSLAGAAVDLSCSFPWLGMGPSSVACLKPLNPLKPLIALQLD